MPPPGPPPPLLNIANVLTGVRLLLVPVFLLTLFADAGQSTGWRYAATGVFVVAAITDRFDGELARSRGLVTAFGTLADPIADKALTGAALIGLADPLAPAVVGHDRDHGAGAGHHRCCASSSCATGSSRRAGAARRRRWCR